MFRQSSHVLSLTPDLLAPGDGKSAALDPRQFDWQRIRAVEEPLFPEAYGNLWAEFGAAGEMETREVLAERFKLGPDMRYEIVFVRQNGGFAAVRDHTAIWCENEVVVHLSHVLVGEPWRRSGLAGWMRAVPILTAREVAAAHGLPSAPVNLVAEMEYLDERDPKRAIRLAAYERAGYKKVDPSVVRYHQPDFRSPETIDASGGPSPLPFQLIVRQVGREAENTLPAGRVRHWIQALHRMYGAQFRPQDMEHPLLSLDYLPEDSASIALLPPTQA